MADRTGLLWELEEKLTRPDFSVVAARHRRERRRRRGVIAGTLATVLALAIAVPVLASSDDTAGPTAVRPSDRRVAGAQWSSLSFANAKDGFAFGTTATCTPPKPHGYSCHETGSYLRSTHDGGRTWEAVPASLPALDGAHLIAISSTVLYATRLQGELSVSTDGGRTWTGVPLPIPGGLAAYDLPVRDGDSLVIDVAVENHTVGTNPQQSCGPGLYVVRGTSVTIITQPTRPIGNNAGLTAGKDGSLWRSTLDKGCSTGGNYNGHVHLSRSTDHGRSWTTVTDPLGNDIVGGMVAYDSTHVWAQDIRTTGADEPGHTNLHLVRSTDGGQTWQVQPKNRVSTEPTSPYPTSATALLPDSYDPIDARHLIAVSAQDLVYASGAQIYYSHDAGATFALATKGNLSTTAVQIISPLSPHEVVALGTDGTLRASTDSGKTWTVRSHL